VAPGEAGRRLADVLEEWLVAFLSRPVPRARVRALVAGGAVRVNGEAWTSAGRPLRTGQVVEAAVHPERLAARATATDRPFVLTKAAILYRDAALIAVDKPPGLPTHPTADPSRPSLVSHVERYLRDSGGGSSLAVHQRLDRDTSGVVLFATDPRANEGLSRAFAGREVHKAYLALTTRPRRLPSRRFRVDAPLGPPGPSRRVVVGGEGASPAETEVIVREVLAGALLVEALPLTGRKHQVRAHLAHAGMPVLGDRTYGGDETDVPRLMLHAWRLGLKHPLSGQPLAIESPPPADFVAAVARLRSGRY
jgi:23S rRNA pseudouridine1911/1915/1917 synthase